MGNKHIAIDLGGSHGRIFVCGENSPLDNIYNFKTRFGTVQKNLHWEILGMFLEIKKGLKLAFNKYDDIVSIGFDTWGVDYALLDEQGELLALPYHFRDSRTFSVIDEVIQKAGGEEEIFKATGIDNESFNTVYQLYETKKRRPQLFSIVSHYLAVPDLFGYWFTGIMESERTHASTTQLYNPFTKDWNWDLIIKLGFNPMIFSPIVDPGTIRGKIQQDIAKEIGCNDNVVFVNSAEHDTASAVSTITKEESKEKMFISSGTWSLVGCLIDTPITTKEAYDKRFTNEVAASGKIRLLRNVMGMWIQQECFNYWEEINESISFEELDKQTLKEKDFSSVIDPLDNIFLQPNSVGGPMVKRIDSWCKSKNLAPPKNKGQYMVAIYKGLAKIYKESFIELQNLTTNQLKKIHIVGGGSKNNILNQWTANFCKVPVIAGPAEASSIGNILSQMKALGEIQTISEGLEKLDKILDLKTYYPE